ncbi:hypothetical protein SteCoe_3549 [Stentor coeruleus]|uniref:Uncharacterized protein n=1 Tax=Stentor coeruleus TaxID=5963 RepID=A0A1R2CWP6_9CILI|nr:hypothetical protein SteCoe_3549 [Stentor coeruleus]
MSSCVLCKEMPCCPEHCCNWDDCTCNDCEACQPKPEIQPQPLKPVVQEPVKIIILGNQPPSAANKPVLESVKDKSLKQEIINTEDSKESFESQISPRPAGNSIFGIRYLRKKK